MTNIIVTDNTCVNLNLVCTQGAGVYSMGIYGGSCVVFRDNVVHDHEPEPLPPGIHWTRTGGKTHTVTIVR